MRKKRTYIKLCLALVVLLLCVLVGMRHNILNMINLDGIKDYIDSYGHFSALIFILLFSLRTLLVIFPYTLFVILGGSIFGSGKAFIYSLISAFICSTLSFFISRFAGKELIGRRIKGKIEGLNLKIEKHGFKIIFFMRISIIFPFDILNFAAGLSKIRYRDFILATLLGIIPETFSLTYLGSNLDEPFSFEFCIALALVLLTVAVPFAINKYKEKNNVKKSS